MQSDGDECVESGVEEVAVSTGCSPSRVSDHIGISDHRIPSDHTRISVSGPGCRNVVVTLVLTFGVGTRFHMIMCAGVGDCELVC